MKLFFITFFAIYTFALLQCPIYKCGDIEDKNQCAITNPTEPTYNLRPCEGAKICAFHPEKSISYCEEHQPTRYPGEYCENNTDCITNKCNNTCIGSKEGIDCSMDADCDVGLYCNKVEGKCVVVKREGDECTVKDKCDSGFACGNDTCVRMGSLMASNKTITPGACRTFYVVNGTCAESPKLKVDGQIDGPIKCNGTCTYTSGNEHTFNLSCSCGYTNGDDLYCNPGIGDVDISDVISFLTT